MTPMNEPIRLGPREKQIVQLLLQGCDNDDIASNLKIARRTVKAHFNRMFMRFGIRDGIKRVKLATFMYRRQLWQQQQQQTQANGNGASLSSLPQDTRMPTSLAS